MTKAINAITTFCSTCWNKKGNKVKIALAFYQPRSGGMVIGSDRTRENI